MKLEIRPFRDQDAEQVASLVKGTLKNINSRDYPVEVIDRISGTWTPDNVKETASKRSIFVAVESERVVGIGMLDDRIAALFVLHDHQMRGIGTKLADAMEKVMQDRGETETFVNSSISAKEFYQNRGYIFKEELYSEYAGKQFKMVKHFR